MALTYTEQLHELFRQQEKTWRQMRILVYSIWKNSTFFPEYPTITAWLEQNFTYSQRCHIFSELQSARIEALLGLEVGTYAYSEWKTLFRINPFRHGKTIVTTVCGQPMKTKVITICPVIEARLRMLWEKTRQIAKERGSSVPDTKDLRKAGAVMHQAFPDIYKPPFIPERQLLKDQIAELNEKLSESHKRQQELLNEIQCLRDEIDLLKHSKHPTEQADEVVDRVKRFYARVRDNKLTPSKAIHLLFASVSDE